MILRIPMLMAVLVALGCGDYQVRAEDNVDALINCAKVIYRRNVDYMLATPAWRESIPELKVDDVEKWSLADVKPKYLKYLSNKFGVSEGQVEKMLQPKLIEAVVKVIQGGPKDRAATVGRAFSEFQAEEYAFTKLVLLDMSSYLQPESIKTAYQLNKTGQKLSFPFPLCAIFGNCR